MAVEYDQSAIREVRDQLFLDHADGKYLNVVSANIGLRRPKIGFSDDQWRAIAKILGINYKQIHTQFERLFEIILGPQVTRYSGLAEGTVAGDKTVKLLDTTNWPQVGTIVFNKGQSSEESIEYCLIDRYNNLIYLNDATTYTRTADSLNANTQLILDITAGDSTFTVADSSQFPTAYPYTVIVGVGTDVEESVAVIDNNIVSNVLTIDSTFANDHIAASMSPLNSLLSLDYVNDTYFITLDSSEKFPDAGVIQFGEAPVYEATGGTTTTVTIAAGSLNVDQDIDKIVLFEGNLTPAIAGEIRTVTDNDDFEITLDSALPAAPVDGDLFSLIVPITATGGTTTTVTVAASTWTADVRVGDQVTFLGNVTSALENTTVNVIAATDAELTFDVTMAGAPVAGDYFYLKPRVQYYRNSLDDNSLILHRTLEAGLSHGTKVNLLYSDHEVGFAPAQISGTNWDVLQNDPRNVELFIPDELNEPNTVRNASYLHPEVNALVTTTLSADANVNDTSITVNNTLGLEPFSMVEINGADILGVVPRVQSQLFEATGSSNDVTGTIFAVTGLTAATLTGVELRIGDLWSATISTNTATTITLDEQMPQYLFDQLVTGIDSLSWFDPNILDIQNDQFIETFAGSGSSVDQYMEVYPGTTLPIGDVWNEENVWPGPYAYELYDYVGTNMLNPTTLAQSLAGPSTIVVSQENSNNAIEVKDASHLALSGFPYEIIVGQNAGTREVAEVEDIGLYQKTQTTVDTASIIGQTFLEVVDLGSAAGERFVNADGYRVLVGRGTGNEEVIYVTGVDGTVSPPQLFCEAMVSAHSAAETVELLADVIHVSNLANDHVGLISFDQRTTRWPTISSPQSAEIMQPIYDEVELVDVTGLDSAGSVSLNLGNQAVFTSLTLASDVAAGATTLTFTDTSSLPTTYPFFVGVGSNTFYEEIVTVTDNTANVLTIDSGLKFAHTTSEPYEYQPGSVEAISYSSIDGNTLRFSSSLMLQSNHHLGESAIGATLLTNLNSEGYAFPLRLPFDIRDQLDYLIDVLRAAGVQVTIITQK